MPSSLEAGRQYLSSAATSAVSAVTSTAAAAGNTIGSTLSSAAIFPLNSQQAADFVEDGARRHNRGICCLQSRTGKYLSTNADGDASCRQSDPSDWETFQVATQREDPAPGLMDATVGDLAASIKAPALIWTLRSVKANKLDPLYLTLNADGEVDFDALGSVTDDE